MFGDMERWIAEHLQGDLRIETLAGRVHMSPRNFARVYAEKRGRTPAKAVEAIRLDAARRRLEETDERIEIIAENCGFNSEEKMRAAFIRNLGIPPRDYRKRFGSGARIGPPLDFRAKSAGKETQIFPGIFRGIASQRIDSMGSSVRR
jgi:transcriptional regulator GlxA family with amidase domain